MLMILSVYLPGVHSVWWRWVWAKSISPSKSFMVWRLLKSKLSKDDQLKHRNFSFSSRCNEEESIDHLFLGALIVLIFGIGCPKLSILVC